MSGGARVVPVIIGRDEGYYRKVFITHAERSLTSSIRSSMASMASFSPVVTLLSLALGATLRWGDSSTAGPRRRMTKGTSFLSGERAMGLSC